MSADSAGPRTTGRDRSGEPRSVWLWWSSGKDSAWTLHQLRSEPELEVTALVTTVDEALEQVAVHATPTALLRQQAEAAGLPLRIVPIPHPCSNAEYEVAVRATVTEALAGGVSYMAFGDLFLEDVKQYRETLFRDSGIEPLFPLWRHDTSALADEMVASGLRAVVTCIDPKSLPRSFAGRQFDASFLADLPDCVDPCGERGEFHTLVYDGPMLTRPLSVATGEIMERDGFVFADVYPV